MTYNPRVHHRRSIRLHGYDYSQSGEYFLTLCSHNRINLFGSITAGVVQLSWIGKIIHDEWIRTEELRQNVNLDAFVIMPNHFHAILIIRDEGREPYRRGEWRFAPTISTPFRSPSKTIGSIVRGFKGATTKRINQIRETPGTPLWQRNYYEHIIRDEFDLQRIREYILNNPTNWDSDSEQ
jgi:REP element-mobilizing transposase RayT